MAEHQRETLEEAEREETPKAETLTGRGEPHSPLFLLNFSTSTVEQMQKIVLVLVPVLLALVAPLYAWSREGVSFALFGCALGIWLCAFAAYLRGRRR